MKHPILFYLTIIICGACLVFGAEDITAVEHIIACDSDMLILHIGRWILYTMGLGLTIWGVIGLFFKFYILMNELCER